MLRLGFSAGAAKVDSENRFASAGRSLGERAGGKVELLVACQPFRNEDPSACAECTKSLAISLCMAVCKAEENEASGENASRGGGDLVGGTFDVDAVGGGEVGDESADTKSLKSCVDMLDLLRCFNGLNASLAGAAAEDVDVDKADCSPKEPRPDLFAESRLGGDCLVPLEAGYLACVIDSLSSSDWRGATIACCLA